MTTPSNDEQLELVTWDWLKEHYPACLKRPRFAYSGTIASEQKKYPRKQFRHFHILLATTEQQGTWAAADGVLFQERVLRHEKGSAGPVIFSYLPLQ